MNVYVFVDESTGNEYEIEAESHPDAIDIAYDSLQEPAFLGCK